MIRDAGAWDRMHAYLCKRWFGEVHRLNDNLKAKLKAFEDDMRINPDLEALWQRAGMSNPMVAARTAPPNVPEEAGLIMLVHPTAWPDSDGHRWIDVRALSRFCDKDLHITMLESRWIVVTLQPWSTAESSYYAIQHPNGALEILGVS